MRPSLANHHAPKIDSPPAITHDPEKWCPVFGQDHAEKGGEAPKGACQPSPRITSKRCRLLMT
jgi:hypothetical protein